jgi:hypothetical protein
MRRAYRARMPSSPQHRRRRIRRTVGAVSLATFAVAWGVIAGTGAMGHSASTTTTTRSGIGRRSWLGAAPWLLPHGGLIVRDDGSHVVIASLNLHTALSGSSQASAR